MTRNGSLPPLTYRDAGVDIDAGQRLVERIAPAVESTRRPEVLKGLGGFGGLFELPIDRYRHPVLVSGTDGVGTKLKLAIDTHRQAQIGIDLVAMCVNDVLVCGAEPLFFLDYYATGRLDVPFAADVIEGIAEGCRQAGATLIGGETAEMPGMYDEGELDLAGFCVGIVEREAMIDGGRVKPGDRIIGLASSGPHANGFSLIRRVLEREHAELYRGCGQTTVLNALMAPTRIYVKSILALIEELPPHAMAHITGGGLVDNLPRVLPDHCVARIDTTAWSRAHVFNWLQENGQIPDQEMWRTFNCGIGFVLVVDSQHERDALERLEQSGERAWCIGEIVADAGPSRVELV